MTPQTDQLHRFLEILGALSAQFINLPPDRIDQAIQAAQERICRALGIDRCTLWRYEKGQENLVMSHMWARSEDMVLPGVLASQKFPWLLGKLLRNETFRMFSTDELPLEASTDRASFQTYGVRSNLTVPLATGGRMIGALSFGMIRSQRQWSDEDIQHLQLVAQVFANALDRKERESAVMESEARLILTADSAGAGLWSLESGTGAIWASERTRELFDLAVSGDLNLESVLSAVHPDDREMVRASLLHSLGSDEDLKIEFRVPTPQGGLRWLTSRGHRGSPVPPGGQARLMGISLDITQRKQAELDLRASYDEIVRLKERLQAEKEYLVAEVHLAHDHSEIIGESKAIRGVLRQIEQVGPTMTTVLLTGETGTGKELVARAIHGLSNRKEKIMVKVDCASLPSGLIESELFGRERGAYTGAMTSQIGRFKLADRSTIFLDEIGELSLDLQAKLLRVLDEKKFEPLGSAKTISVDVRIIAATNRDLARAVREGRFREDLYYRLQVFPINVPPLRERIEDIPLLVWHFVRKFSSEMAKGIRRIPRQSMEALQHYSWPGNVRELKNLIEQAFIVSRGDSLTIRLPSLAYQNASERPKTLEQAEREHILHVLSASAGRIKGSGGAAEVLGVKPSTLYSKMKKLGIPNRQAKGDPPT